MQQHTPERLIAHPDFFLVDLGVCAQTVVERVLEEAKKNLLENLAIVAGAKHVTDPEGEQVIHISLLG